MKTESVIEKLFNERTGNYNKIHILRTDLRKRCKTCYFRLTGVVNLPGPGRLAFSQDRDRVAYVMPRAEIFFFPEDSLFFAPKIL